MRLVQTPKCDLLSWDDGGCYVTGNPLVADPDPNVTPPANNRIARVLYARSRLLCLTGEVTTHLMVKLIGGSGTDQLTANKWFFDATLNKWVKIGLPNQVVQGFSGANLSGISMFNDSGLINLPGIKYFVQIVTVTGTPTAMGYGFVG